MRKIFGANSLAAVLDCDSQCFATLTVTLFAVTVALDVDPLLICADLGFDRELAMRFHRVHCVQEEIEKYLFELVGVAVDCVGVGSP